MKYVKKIEKFRRNFMILLTLILRCVTLKAVMDVEDKPFEYYDSDLNYYFIVCVQTPEGFMYAYNQRMLVHDEAFAKRFDTRRSALRCIALSNYKDYEILKKRRLD